MITKEQQERIEELNNMKSLTAKQQTELDNLLKLEEKPVAASGVLTLAQWKRCPRSAVSSVNLDINTNCSLHLGKQSLFNFDSYIEKNRNSKTKMEWVNGVKAEFGDDFVSVSCEFNNNDHKTKTNIFLPTLKNLPDDAVKEVDGVLMANNDLYSFGLNKGVPTVMLKAGGLTV